VYRNYLKYSLVGRSSTEKLASGQRNGRSPCSSNFPRKVILNSVQITEQLLLSHNQASDHTRKEPSETETKIADKQAGFRQGGGTRDQITNLRILMHKAREHQQPLYMCFVDFKKAFDSISHDKLCVTMMDMRHPLHWIDLLATLYRKQLAKVKVAGTLSVWFCVKKGVRQGCVLFAYFFNILVEMVMSDDRDPQWTSRWTTNWRANSQEPSLRWWHHPVGNFRGKTTGAGGLPRLNHSAVNTAYSSTSKRQR